MSNLDRKEMKELVDIISLSNLDVLVFVGYTTRREVDIGGESRYFLEDEMKYFKLTTIHGSNLYVSQRKLVDVALGEAELEAGTGDIYAHGYPEGRLTPDNHAEESEEAFLDRYLEEYEAVIKEGLEDLLV